MKINDFCSSIVSKQLQIVDFELQETFFYVDFAYLTFQLCHLRKLGMKITYTL